MHTLFNETVKEVDDIALESETITKKANNLGISVDSRLTRLKKRTKKFDSIRDCLESMKNERKLFFNKLDTAHQLKNSPEHELSIRHNVINEMEVKMGSAIEYIHVTYFISSAF